MLTVNKYIRNPLLSKRYSGKWGCFVNKYGSLLIRTPENPVFTGVFKEIVHKERILHFNACPCGCQYLCGFQLILPN